MILFFSPDLQLLTFFVVCRRHFVPLAFKSESFPQTQTHPFGVANINPGHGLS